MVMMNLVLIGLLLLVIAYAFYRHFRLLRSRKVGDTRKHSKKTVR